MVAIESIEKKIKVTFNTKSLLRDAVTHKSYAKQQRQEKVADNERLEYFGDAVLKLIVTDYLYHKFPKESEGELTKKRASMIADKCLSQIASQLDLGRYLRLSHGEKQSGGAERPSNLANAVEALIGAIYLDQGYSVAKVFFMENFDKIPQKERLFLGDFKTELQEHAQKKYQTLPEYTLLSERGPEHGKVFSVQVKINHASETLEARGEGNSKKEAEQEAAQKLKTLLGL